MFEEYFVAEVSTALREINHSFGVVQCEASLLTPNELINKGYTDEDVFRIGDELTLRPETTMGSYEYAKEILNVHYKPKTRMPICVWQHGKSFRNEQDKAEKNMRLKEFYQLEFQIIFSKDTANDYYEPLLQSVKDMINKMIGECYIIESDRLPDYSERTMDIQMKHNDMEICSMSQRKDFDGANVIEIAIGTDRCIYNFNLLQWK